MLAGIFHNGSGLGNQLFRYIAVRTLALDNGYDFGMENVHNFKGNSFMKLNMGNEMDLQPENFTKFTEKCVRDSNNVDIRGYDPEINFIEDNTILDGEFQDPRYFEHRMKEIDEWLKVEPIKIADDVCVIGFRGGEYALYPGLFLPKEYWEEAKVLMLQKNISMKFEVHTDDEVLARQFFPDYKIIHDIGINWCSMRYAKYAIIANSSFYILPRLLSSGMTIAPRWWARRNTKVWALPSNFYKAFTYI